MPLSVLFNAAAALQVSAAQTSAIVSFCIAPRMAAEVSKSPIGAEPGFQSEAMTSEVPASNNLRAGAKGSPNPSEAPGTQPEPHCLQQAMRFLSHWQLRGGRYLVHLALWLMRQLRC